METGTHESDTHTYCFAAGQKLRPQKQHFAMEWTPLKPLGLVQFEVLFTEASLYDGRDSNSSPGTIAITHNI